MPKRTDIKKILIIGSGPIVIGQAAEFDYAGVQACLALRGEGVETILVNSNPATVMTDPDVGGTVVIGPLTVAHLTSVIEAHRPDALLPTMAWGQNIGRPDHQSLILLLVTIAIGLEVYLIHAPERRSAQIWAGIAWGCALWTSLFEPLVLLVAMVIIQTAQDWRGMLLRRPFWWLSLFATCAAAFAMMTWSPIRTFEVIATCSKITVPRPISADFETVAVG